MMLSRVRRLKLCASTTSAVPSQLLPTTSTSWVGGAAAAPGARDSASAIAPPRNAVSRLILAAIVPRLVPRRQQLGDRPAARLFLVVVVRASQQPAPGAG